MDRRPSLVFVLVSFAKELELAAAIDDIVRIGYQALRNELSVVCFETVLVRYKVHEVECRTV